MTSLAREQWHDWLADHLPALQWLLLALWLPPVAMTLGVDLGLIESAGSGYASLRDPALVLSTAQVTLIAASLPGMSARRARSWRLALLAVCAWGAHAAWSIQGRLRLTGISDLASKETVITLAGLGVVSMLVLEVRARYTTVAPITHALTKFPQRVVPLRGTTSNRVSRFRKPESRVG